MAESISTAELARVDSSTTPGSTEFESETPEDLLLLFQKILLFCAIQASLLCLSRRRVNGDFFFFLKPEISLGVPRGVPRPSHAT